MTSNSIKETPTFFIDDMLSNLAMTARLYAKPGKYITAFDDEDEVLLGYSPLDKNALTFSYSHQFDNVGNYDIISKLSSYASKASKVIATVGQGADILSSSLSTIENIVGTDDKEKGAISTLINEFKNNDLATKLTTNRFVSATENSYMFDGTIVAPPITELTLIYVSGMKYGTTGEPCNVKKCIEKFLYYTIGDYKGITEKISGMENAADLFGFIESPNGFQWSKSGVTSNESGSESGTFYLNYGEHDKVKVINNLLISNVSIKVSPYIVKGTGDYYYAIIDVTLVPNKLRTRNDLLDWMGLNRYNIKSATNKEVEKDKTSQSSQLTDINNIKLDRVR